MKNIGSKLIALALVAAMVISDSTVPVAYAAEPAVSVNAASADGSLDDTLTGGSSADDALSGWSGEGSDSSSDESGQSYDDEGNNGDVTADPEGDENTNDGAADGEKQDVEKDDEEITLQSDGDTPYWSDEAEGIKYYYNITDDSAHEIEVYYITEADESAQRGTLHADIPSSVPIDDTDYSIVSLGNSESSDDWLHVGNAVGYISIPASVRSIRRVSGNHLKEVEFDRACPITEIPDDAFNNSGIDFNVLEKVILPDSVEEIGERAFYLNTRLTTVNFPESLRKIGKEAFCYTALTELDLNTGLEYIGESAFRTDSSIGSGLSVKNIVIPDSVTEIGDYAFSVDKDYEGVHIESVKLGSGLKDIGIRAFEYNHISELTIPASVETIGERAFYSNSELTDITVESGSSLVSVGESAFRYCPKLKKADFSGAASEDIVLGTAIFSDDDVLDEVYLPPNINKIPDYAFSDTNLTHVTLSESVKEIGTAAFAFIPLTDINLPSGLESIGDSAFAGCEDLKIDLIIPASVSCIGENAFGYWDRYSPTGTISSGTYELKMYGSGIKSLVIEEGSTPLVISNGAFAACTGLNGTDIILPARVSKLGEGVFHFIQNASFYINNPNMELAYISESSGVSSVLGVSGIGLNGFDFIRIYDPGAEEAQYVKPAQYEDGHEQYTIEDGRTVFEGYLCDIPDPWSSDEVFYGMDLRSYYSGQALDGGVIYYPGELKEYSDSHPGEVPGADSGISPTLWGYIEVVEGSFGYLMAHNNHTDTLGESEDSIPVVKLRYSSDEEGASVCPTLVAEGTTRVQKKRTQYKVRFDANGGYFPYEYDGTTPYMYYIRDSIYGWFPVVERDDYKFGGWYTSASGGRLVTTADSVDPDITRLYAHWYDPSSGDDVYELSFGSGITGRYYEATGKLVISGTGEMADYEGESSPLLSANKNKLARFVTAIEIEDGITHIGDNAFLDCAKLTSVLVPSSVTSIGEYAFQGCSSLETISATSQIAAIGEYAFYDCSSLTSYELNSDITALPEGIFKGCSSLAEITLPAGLTSIGGAAFSGCSQLENIDIPSTVTMIYTDNGGGHITGGTFAGAGIKSIIIPSGVEEIQASTFSGCDQLTSVTLPDTVTTIYSYSFSSCTALNSITLPSGLGTIANKAFEFCTSLEEITIPESVTNIMSGAFYSCTSLKTVNLSNDDGTGISIEDGYHADNLNAFSGCCALETINLDNVAFYGGYTLPFIFTYAPTSGTGTRVTEMSDGPTYSGTLTKTPGVIDMYIGDIDANSGKNVTASFNSSTGVLTIDGNGDIDEYDSTLTSENIRDKIKEVVIKSGITYIPSGYFDGCDNLATITLGNVTLSADCTLPFAFYTGREKITTLAAETAYNTTLTAGSTYTVSYDPQGGTVYITATPSGYGYHFSPDLSPKAVREGGVYGELPVVIREGYDFDGWYTSAVGGSPVTENDEVTGNQTLYAQWTGQDIIVRFDGNGGTVTSIYQSKTNTVGDKYSLPLDIAAPERYGYTFIGWYTEKEGGEKVTSDTIVTIPYDHTLYAHWSSGSSTVKSVKVTLNANGGTLPSGSSSSFTKETGDEYGELPTPVYAGRSFLGWYTDKTDGDRVTRLTTVEITSNHTLYARWELNDIAVAYDAAGGVFASNAGGTITSDGRVYIKHITDKYGTLPTVTRTGYTFAGWYYTDASSGKETKLAAATGLLCSEDHRITARWTANTYKVTLDLQGGEAVDGGITTLTVTYDSTYGEALADGRTALADNKLPVAYKSGVTFAGWYTTDGTDGDENTKVTSSTVYDLNASDGRPADHTLYARWVLNEYTVNFNPDGGSRITGGNGEAFSFTIRYGEKYSDAYNDADNKPADAASFDELASARTGYVFDGWYTADGSEGDDGVRVEGLTVCDLTTAVDALYAHWTPAEYKVTFDTNADTSADPAQIATLADTEGSVAYQESYGTLPVPVSKGYEFDGWYTKASGVTESDRVEAGTVYNTASPADHTLYAHWTRKYNVTVRLNGGSLAGLKVTSLDVRSDAKLRDSDGRDTADPITYEALLKEYGVVFGDDNKPDTAGISRAKYTFKGWYKENSDGTPAEEAFDFKQAVTADTVITARWNASGRLTVSSLGTDIRAAAADTGNGTIAPYKDGVSDSKVYEDTLISLEAGAVISEITTDITDGRIYYAVVTDTSEDSAVSSILSYLGESGNDLTPAGFKKKVTDSSWPLSAWKLYTGAINAAALAPSNASAADDYEIYVLAYAEREGYTDSNVTLFRYTVQPEATLWGDIILKSSDGSATIRDDSQYCKDTNGTVSVASVPAGLWVAGLESGGYAYTAENRTFTFAAGSTDTTADLRVYFGKKLLSYGTDYTVAYKNNKAAYALADEDAGYTASRAPSIVINCKGNYTGTLTQTFKINPVDLGSAASDGKFSAPDIVLAYNGKVQKGTTTVSFTNENGKVITLKAGTDFTYGYPKTDSKADDYSVDAFKAASAYTVNITGKGNFTGSTSFNETITNAVLISRAAASKISARPHTGSEIPAADEAEDFFTLTYNKSVLKGATRAEYDGLEDNDRSDIDYIYTFKNNTEVGTASIEIEGVGAYAGTRTLTFAITGTNIASLPSVWGEDNKIAAMPYTGVTAKQDKLTIFKDKSKTTGKLIKGTDYDVTYSPEDPVSVGKVTVTYTGKGGYTGSIKKTYSITAYDLTEKNLTEADKKVSITVPDRISYTKGGARPAVTVTFKKPKTNEEDGYDTVTLEENTDYTVTYRNNTKVYTYGESDEGFKPGSAPCVRIKGKGDFSGQYANVYFKIEGQSLGAVDNDGNSLIAMTAADKVYTTKAGNYATTVILTDTDGKKLAAGTDYEKVLSYSYVESTELSDGTIRGAGEEVLTTDIVPVGTWLKVTAAGKGSYAGSNPAPSTLSATYKIISADISRASVVVPAQYYTGYEIRPDKREIQVTLNKVVLSDEDYEILSYSNNVNKGNATLIIRGLKDYGGTKTVSFVINNRPALYTVVFKGNGATSGRMNALTLNKESQALTANSYRKNGAEFAGWDVIPDAYMKAAAAGTSYTPVYTDKEVISRASLPSGTYTLYAQWAPVDYTITYHLNGGVNNPLNTRIGYTSSDESFAIYAPESENWSVGYKFGGWYKENTYKNPVSEVRKGSTGNLDLYAKWEPYTYTVKFDSNRGEDVLTPAQSRQTVADEVFSYGAARALNPNKYTRNGYVFAGWSTDKSAVLPAYTDKEKVADIVPKDARGNTIMSEVTLYAVWRNSFNVTFIPDGGSVQSLTDTPKANCVNLAVDSDNKAAYQYGQGLTYNLPAAVKAGYRFDGWYKDEALKSKLNSIAKNSSGDMTLHAKWTPYTYNISFNANDGSARPATKAQKNIKYDAATPLTANTFVRKGYAFKGWAYSNAVGAGVVLEDKADAFNLVKTGSDGRLLSTDVVLYAVWEEAPYTISY